VTAESEEEQLSTQFVGRRRGKTRGDLRPTPKPFLPCWLLVNVDVVVVFIVLTAAAFGAYGATLTLPLFSSLIPPTG
jgi:hypothetical protein